jgi:hypothetical protein
MSSEWNLQKNNSMHIETRLERCTLNYKVSLQNSPISFIMLFIIADTLN